MQHPKYLTPRLSWTPIVIVTLWCVIQFELYLTHYFDRGDIDYDWELYLKLWLTGATYGVAAGGCWIATAWDHVFARYFVRTLVAALAALVLTRVGTDDLLRHLTNLGGLLVFQCILFFLLRLPSWQARDGRSSTTGDYQFRIADVIVATTSIALLLSAAIRYSAPIESSYYWLVSVVLWGIGPVIACCVFMGWLSRAMRRMSGLIAAAIVMTAATTGGLSFAVYLANNRLFGVDLILPIYACLMSGFLVSLLIIGMAARLSCSPTSPDADMTAPRGDEDGLAEAPQP